MGAIGGKCFISLPLAEILHYSSAKLRPGTNGSIFPVSWLFLQLDLLRPQKGTEGSPN